MITVLYVSTVPREARNKTKNGEGLHGSAFPMRWQFSLEEQLQSELDLSRIVGSIASGSNLAESLNSYSWSTPEIATTPLPPNPER